MKIIPMGNRLIVKLDPMEEVTPGGIILPTTAQEHKAIGTVQAVGEGKTDNNGNRIAMSFKVGDRVLFHKHSGSPLELPTIDKSILVLDGDSVMAKLVED